MASNLPPLPAPVVFVRQKIAPLALTVSSSEPKRVNLLIPTVDFNYVFGGYIAKFNLARRLAETGFVVRIVIVDQCDFQPETWKQQLLSFEGLGNVLDRCELAYVYERSVRLKVNPNDGFIATTWWTAHIAQQAARTLGKRDFVYLIQEFEPFTFPMGSFASLAEQTYRWPHYALFSTELLRDYFRDERLGVFAGECQEGERRSAVFQNAITQVDTVTPDSMRRRSSRKVLFYARPEGHASRNMFELGMVALCAAIDGGVFDQRWEFTGIGSVELFGRMHLSQGRYMHFLLRQNQAEYRQVLMAHDLGLSLMYTPHPSLVPIEMASAGMVVITNTFRNKTADALRSISPNLVGVEATVDGLVAGLRAAVAKVEQFQDRAAGSHVNWSRDWSEALGPAVMERVAGFLRQISA